MNRQCMLFFRRTQNENLLRRRKKQHTFLHIPAQKAKTATRRRPNTLIFSVQFLWRKHYHYFVDLIQLNILLH